MMFDELRYRWALRKFLKGHDVARRSYDQVPDERDQEGMNFPKYTAGKALNFQSFMLDTFRSRYLLDQAVRYHVPIPTKEEDWQRTGRRQIFRWCRRDAAAGLSGADLADASAVNAEISGDVVLSISANRHPFNNRDLSVVQCHGSLCPSCDSKMSSPAQFIR